MRILVTGASGFLGYHVMEELIMHKDFKVLGIVRNKNHPRIESLKNCLFKEADLKDKDGLKKILNEFLPEVIVHLAWNGVYNSAHQESFQYENRTQTLSLIELSKCYGLKHFIGLGSQAEYGLYNRKINEEDLLNPKSLYGKIKAQTGLNAHLLCERLGVEFTWLRLFSGYGPYDDPRWLIPYVIHTLKRQESPKLTHGDQIWDYLFVQDIARAITACIYKKAYGFFNLASGRQVTIKNVVKEIHKILNSSVTLRFGEIPLKKTAIKHLEADITKFSKIAQWSPSISLEEGLSNTIKSMSS